MTLLKRGDDSSLRNRDAVVAGAGLTIAAAIALVLCAVLMITGYVKCPYLDEWWIVRQLADGASPRSLSWLWSQQNEHRILVPRLLIWLDLYAFGGRNISLFLLTFATQTAHWLLWLFAVRRWSGAPRSVQLMMQGVFGYCLFCPNQIENFVWAFQFSFVLPFFLATLAFTCILLMDDVKRPQLYLATAIAAPFIAMCNLAGGIIIWPFLLLIAVWRKRSRRELLVLFVIAAGVIGIYYTGYQTPPYHSNPIKSLGNPYAIYRYILTYFGTSWWFLLPHLARTLAFGGLLLFLFLIVRSRGGLCGANKFRILLITEGLFLLATALVTALGRVTLGIGQASSSRYQTPAMLFWASLASLLLLWAHEYSRQRLVTAIQSVLLIVAALSLLGLPEIYSVNRQRAQRLRAACEVVSSGGRSPRLTERLSDRPELIEKGGALLRSIWNRH